MADPNSTVFDISSDEEPAAGFEDSKAVRENNDDDYDWLTELLRTVDKERREDDGGGDDDDEVVVVGEYNPTKTKSKSKSTKLVMDDDDDDDCVVLDGDPDKALAVSGEGEDGGGGSDGEDVLVVGEKGQIACRDYPHPRHHCAKFPFNSTPHESHCDLCHCFVCDSLAPCAFWRTGASPTDHCHATDKQEIWKSQRECVRLQKKVLPVAEFPNTLPVVVSQINQIPPPIDISQLVPNQMLQNQVSRPTTIRPFPTRMAVPNIISQGRNNQSGSVLGRNMSRPQSVPWHGRRIHSNFIRRDTVPSAGNLGQQFVSSHTMFKRPGIIRGAFTKNQSVHGSSNNMNCAPSLQCTRNAAPLPASMVQISTGQQDILTNMNLGPYPYNSSLQPNMGSVAASTVPSQSEVYSESMSLLNGGQNIYNLGNQTSNVSNSGFSDIDIGWVDDYSQTSNEYIQGAGSNNVPSTVSQFSSQLTGSPQDHHRDYEYDNWFANESVPVPSEGYSLEHPVVDTSMLCFDYDTSFGGLMHVQP